MIFFENVTENLHSVQGKMLFDQLINYRFLQDARFVLRTDSSVMECCERLLHQNKIVAFSAHQITCLFSVMGLNYRGRWCQMVSCWHAEAAWTGAEFVRRACVCVSCVVGCYCYSIRCCYFTWGFEGVDWVKCFLIGLVLGWLREVFLSLFS